MSVVSRKRKRGYSHFVVIKWKGRQYWELVGSDKREAHRLNTRRLAEVAAGTYQPPQSGGRVSVAKYAAEWLDRRRNRSVEHERYLLEDVALAGAKWFASMALEDVRPKHVLRLIDELKATGRAPKTVTNAVSVMRNMFRHAHVQEHIVSNPVDIGRGVLSRKGVQPKTAYDRAECVALLSAAVADQRRAFVALALYTGMRCGEICGRRWRDWLRDAEPLTALSVTTQYDDQPLKGDDEEKARPRKIPVHPSLDVVLSWWFAQGWELAYCRKPTADDFIVPSTQGRGRRCYTQSGARKVWAAACRDASVGNRSLHATRHTFTTHARRCHQRADIIESITHNASGAMVDHYNHWEWEPRCEVVSALTFDSLRLDGGLTRSREQQDSRLRRLDSKQQPVAKTKAKGRKSREETAPDGAAFSRGPDKTGAQGGAGYPEELAVAIGEHRARATAAAVRGGGR